MTSTEQGARAPVMADVARLAGVSHQTVSRVINGRTNLRPQTRERVVSAIAQLGYRPNAAARSLVTKRSSTIGVIGSKTALWGPSTVHRTIQAAGREAGFFVSSVNLPAFSRADLTDAIDHLRDQNVEGIVLIAAHDEAVHVARAQEDLGTPVVVVEGDHHSVSLTVGVDQLAGGRLATRHLVEAGRRRVAHLAGPQSWTEARGRLDGWRATLLEADLPVLDVVEGDWSAESGYALGERVVALEPDAVFCANDHMALGLLRHLAEAGLAVPGDVQVVGFDDTPESGYFQPPLTTVRQDFTAVGRRAIAILGAAIAGDPVPAGLIAPELVVRRTTTPDPARPPADERPAR